MTNEQTTPRVFEAITRVTADLAKGGVSKKHQNAAQNFKYRSIDDVMNAIAPVYAEHKLVVIPAYGERQVQERTSGQGRAVFYVTLAAQFTLISAEDGSSFVAGPFYGEAMDSGDKAVNKAMSIAYKYFALQTFAIPVEGTPDPDADSHDTLSKSTEELIADSLAAIKGCTGKDSLRELKDQIMGIGNRAVWEAAKPAIHARLAELEPAKEEA